jgi:hypothetical protein
VIGITGRAKPLIRWFAHRSTRAAGNGAQPLINLVHINVDDRISISVTRIDAERADSSRNRFIGNDHVDHSSDARGLAVVNVKFRVRPAVFAAKMTKVA